MKPTGKTRPMRRSNRPGKPCFMSQAGTSSNGRVSAYKNEKRRWGASSNRLVRCEGIGRAGSRLAPVAVSSVSVTCRRRAGQCVRTACSPSGVLPLNTWCRTTNFNYIKNYTHPQVVVAASGAATLLKHRSCLAQDEGIRTTKALQQCTAEHAPQAHELTTRRKTPRNRIVTGRFQ